MRTVFHCSSSAPAAQRHALGNVANLLDAAPGGAVALVANADAVDLLCTGSPDPDRVGALADRGVRFLACENALAARDRDPSALLPGVESTPAGVATLSRLQSAGYAYLKVP
ncbi:MAG: DsrE family protein [Halobacteriaceae archaeon]